MAPFSTTLHFTQVIIGDTTTLMMPACRRGNLEAMKILLEAGADTTINDGAGEPLINIASDYGHIDIIQFLLDSGSDVNSESMIHTPLIAAGHHHHPLTSAHSS